MRWGSLTGHQAILYMDRLAVQMYKSQGHIRSLSSSVAMPSCLSCGWESVASISQVTISFLWALPVPECCLGLAEQISRLFGFLFFKL